MRLLLAAMVFLLPACGQSARQAAATSPATSTMSAAPASTSAPVWNAASAHSWDRNLLTLMPEIDACIDGLPHARTVTYAGPERDGLTLVRLQGETARIDCRVDHDTVRIRQRDRTLEIAEEGRAIFVRGPGENPGGECYQAPEVRDGTGALLGWMIDPEGC